MDWERLARYVVGECSPEEAAETERWIELDPARREAADDMRTLWANAQVTPSGWDAESAWQALSKKLDAAHQRARTPSRPRRIPATLTRRGISPALRIAAAVMVVTGAALLYKQLAPSWQTHGAPSPAAMREYATRNGERAEFDLGDGTHVVLSVASRLRVSADYGTEERRVYLEGEGYFEVRHDPGKRFFVHAAGTVTEDLGTRFGVRAYPDDRAVQVTVAEGSVALRGTLLTQGQLGRTTAGGGVEVRQGVDLDRYLGWTDGRLVFENTPLRDALPQLNRWYDLDFRLGDSALATLPVTATFKNQPTNEMLELLALSLGVRQERQGRTVTFYAGAPPR